MSGAVAGTPGTAPTNWAITGGHASIVTTIAVGTINNMNFIDVRFNGTNSSGGNVFPNIVMQDQTAPILTGPNTPFELSFWTMLTAGTSTNFTSPGFGFEEWNSIFVRNNYSGVFTFPTSLTKKVLALTVGTSVTKIQYIRAFIATIANGAAVDATIRIASPLLVQTPKNFGQ